MNRHIAPLERRGEIRPEPENVHHQAALLIDFDNVTMGIRSNLGQELRSLLNSDVIRGKVAVQRAYADWRRYPQYIVPLSEASIDLIFAPAYGSSKKNATDIRLAIDALELVFIRPEIRTYILMSGDSDFSSLVLKLKEYGKYVIGVGIQESSSDLLVQNCDEYYSYTALSGLSKTSDQVLEKHDPWQLAAKAVDKMVERGDTMRSDRLKQVMLEIDPSFDEKEHGFNKFNRFVVQAASKGLVSIQKMENGQYGVAAGEKGGKVQGEKQESKEPRGSRAGGRRDRERGGEKDKGKPRERRVEPATKATEPEAPVPGEVRGARPKLTMAAALELLDKALGILLEGGIGTVRDSDVKRRMLELDPNFDEGELGYSKFSKFLQAAEERGAIDLERGPNGNYHVSRSSGTKKKTAAAATGDTEELSTGESTMKRLARFFFGPGKLEPEGLQTLAAPEATKPEVARPEAVSEPRP
ncbi:MAG TPA: NYN domain-containing protein, partial [Gemmatimonadota bacterium]|nr:NYN domain-containing protein [Gemmatimonadota bacterium]